MERSSEVILRNASRLPTAGVMLLNPPRDTLFRQLENPQRPVQIFTQNHGDYCWHIASGANVQFGLIPGADEISSTVILHLPREKELLRMMLHALSSAMQPRSCLWLVGDNKAGIKSAKRYLDGNFRQVSKLDAARHCGLFEARMPLSGEPFSLDSYQAQWPVSFADGLVNVVSLPGVFTHGRLDQGSRLLLKTLESLRPAGRVLDFACGSGVIGCSLLAAGSDATLTLLDVSALAIKSSHLTLTLNGLRATVLPSDGLSQLQGTFDWIISNPPFHRGIHNDLEIAALFFAEAGTFLAENGRIVIVCNRHLPYASWLQNHFGHVEQLEADDQFTVILAARPRNR